MAFALTSMTTWAEPIQTASNYRGAQVIQMTITGADTDTAADIGDFGGTFWTDALADSTYGGIATAALAQLELIAAQAQSLIDLRSETLIAYTRVKSVTATTEYSVAVENHLPKVTFVSGSAPTAWTIEIVQRPNEFVFPVALSIG